MEKKESEGNVLERIQNSGKTLEVTRDEIVVEMNRFESKQDKKGMKDLFDAYKDWEVKNRKEGMSIEQAEELVARNFDTLAKVTDNMEITGGHEMSALVLTVERSSVRAGGKITRFVRESIGYEPPPEDSTSQN